MKNEKGMAYFTGALARLIQPSKTPCCVLLTWSNLSSKIWNLSFGQQSIGPARRVNLKAMPKRPPDKAAGGDCQRARETRPWACLLVDQAKILDCTSIIIYRAQYKKVQSCTIQGNVLLSYHINFLNLIYIKIQISVNLPSLYGSDDGLSQEGFRRWCHTPCPVLAGEFHWFFGGSYSNLASWIRFFVPRTQRPFIPCSSFQFECYLYQPYYVKFKQK